MNPAANVIEKIILFHSQLCLSFWWLNTHTRAVHATGAGGPVEAAGCQTLMDTSTKGAQWVSPQQRFGPKDARLWCDSFHKTGFAAWAHVTTWPSGARVDGGASSECNHIVVLGCWCPSPWSVSAIAGYYGHDELRKNTVSNPHPTLNSCFI